MALNWCHPASTRPGPIEVLTAKHFDINPILYGNVSVAFRNMMQLKL